MPLKQLWLDLTLEQNAEVLRSIKGPGADERPACRRVLEGAGEV